MTRLFQALKNFKWMACATILSGLLGGVSTQVPHTGFLAWIALVPFFYCIFELISQNAKKKRILALCILFFAFYYLITDLWIFLMYPLDFLDIPHIEAFLFTFSGWIITTIAQMIPACALVFLAALLSGFFVRRRMGAAAPFLVAAAMIVNEWFTTLFWFGVPLSQLYLGQAPYYPVIQTASLFGANFVSFLIIAVNMAVVLSIRLADRRRLCAVVALAVFAGNLLFGIVFVAVQDALVKEGEKVVVGAIQANQDRNLKYSASNLSYLRELCRDLTAQAAAKGATVVVWPETEIPLKYSGNENSTLALFSSDLAEELHVDIVTGVYYTDGDSLYNASVLIRSDGTVDEEVYCKIHVVPFGEYMPLEWLSKLLPGISDLPLDDDQLSPGQNIVVWQTDTASVGPMICYDSPYADIARLSTRKGAGILTNQANDSWFEHSFFKTVHVAHGKMRAVECGRGFVQAADTGISTVTDWAGRTVSATEPNTETVTVGELTIRTHRTLYVLIGDAFIYLCISFVSFGACAAIVIRILEKRRTAAEKDPSERENF
ncbi:MAG: apolipoprotein N-acyltransferase [Clostridia bacterium]|nr:apolipoprotein N-acyltransferase [Clostridia bacterium]